MVSKDLKGLTVVMVSKDLKGLTVVDEQETRIHLNSSDLRFN